MELQATLVGFQEGEGRVIFPAVSSAPLASEEHVSAKRHHNIDFDKFQKVDNGYAPFSIANWAKALELMAKRVSLAWVSDDEAIRVGVRYPDYRNICRKAEWRIRQMIVGWLCVREGYLAALIEDFCKLPSWQQWQYLLTQTLGNRPTTVPSHATPSSSSNSSSQPSSKAQGKKKADIKERRNKGPDVQSLFAGCLRTDCLPSKFIWNGRTFDTQEVLDDNMAVDEHMPEQPTSADETGDYFMPATLPSSNGGLWANKLEDRAPFLRALAELMSTWKAVKFVSFQCQDPQTGERWGEYEYAIVEAYIGSKMTHIYHTSSGQGHQEKCY
ncbi:hypothetical protein FISHEDRAFT_61227 [Fistulina hepatica ATCC 64428]|uniref:Uncharacterized protein n=1 Tax=Fistulina hepatica ATCC 64428 TaxID=1128425 RepID=A0A0D7A2V4_9AGAR|nr:hypothetical protein FISHEDRAFT_61227 [Fistulina hepatica ATCC 64428]